MPWVRSLVLAVGALPLLEALLRALGWGAAAAPLDAWFAFQCHQDHARLAPLPGLALPVCARCAGIYLGLLLGAALRWPRLGLDRASLLVAGASVLMIVDVVTERAGLRPGWALVRAFTGLALSYPLGALVAEQARPPAPRP